MNWWDFFSWFLGGGLGAFIGTSLARWFWIKRDRAEHDRQMADWDKRLDGLKAPLRLHTHN